MKKHYETYVEDTDKLISVAGPVLDYKSWYEQYRKLMEEQAQRKYGLYTPTSEGDDDFPSISGMIARYSALGLTNEQMAENPVWKDLTGNGHDLQMKNFAWKGMSGVNGYKFDFLLNEWATSNEQISEKYSYKIVINNKQNSVQLINNSGHIKITLKITGIEINKSIFRVYDNAGMEHKQDYTKDGIYEIDYTANEGANKIYFYVVGGNTGQLENPITIEQLPFYPGFILGDGVDDFAVTEKELNFEDTYTVYTAFIPFQNNPTRNMILCGADSKKTFSMQYSSLVYVSFIAGNNYYINADFVNGLNLFACKRNGNNICIKNLLTNKVVTGTCGDWVENAGLYYLWNNATYASFAKAAIAGQTICNGYFSTDEDDEKVLNWYKKQYPWLFPDQAWTVVGKTNEDEDRATIANITGNGNDLVLSNFGFAEGSGYNEEGEYAGYLVTDGVDDRVVSSSFTLNKDWTIVGNWKMLQPEANKLSGIVKQNSLFIYNHVDGLNISINDAWNFFKLKDIRSVNAICSDGRIYLNDWTEIIDSKQQTVNESVGTLVIGILGNVYTSLAFKNLGFYNNQNLSKDDCIKAYNYLQTLKAK